MHCTESNLDKIQQLMKCQRGLCGYDNYTMHFIYNVFFETAVKYIDHSKEI